LLVTFIIGVLLTLLGARFYPLPDATRYRSDSMALANGGREESFFIRLPDDRLGSPRAAAVEAFPLQSFASEGDGRVLAELFRLRDSEGRVVGLASKMTGDVAVAADRARENADWMILIPSRGALLGSTQGLPTDENQRYPRGYMGLDPGRAGLLLHGTGDFAGLTGFFQEDVRIAGVDGAGLAEGELELKFRIQGNVE